MAQEEIEQFLCVQSNAQHCGVQFLLIKALVPFFFLENALITFCCYLIHNYRA